MNVGPLDSRPQEKRSEMLVAEIDRAFVRAAPGRIPSRLLAQFLFEGRPPMTRGKIFDRLTLRHLEIVASRWHRTSLDRPIFVIGIGRSGTTLLGRILAAHPDVAYLKEPKAVWSSAVDAEDVSGHYQPYGRFKLDAADATDEVTERVSRILNWFVTVSRGKRVVDKYPEMTYRTEFLKALFPDAKIVAIVRHPAAVVESIVRFSESMGDERGNWWGVRDAKWHRIVEEFLGGEDVPNIGSTTKPASYDPRERALTEWVLGAQSILGATQRIDAIVRYEDLLANPEDVVRIVSEACELDPGPVMSYASQIIDRPATLSGAPTYTAEVTALLEAFGYLSDR